MDFGLPMRDFGILSDQMIITVKAATASTCFGATLLGTGSTLVGPS